MTKKEIVKTISEEIGLTQLKTKEIVQKTFDAIVETLVEDHRIELRNFGVFEVKQRAARKARNPRTGDESLCAREVRRHVQAGQGDGRTSPRVGTTSRRGPSQSGGTDADRNSAPVAQSSAQPAGYGAPGQ